MKDEVIGSFLSFPMLKKLSLSSMLAPGEGLHYRGLFTHVQWEVMWQFQNLLKAKTGAVKQ